jgi:hypothetical protein
MSYKRATIGKLLDIQHNQLLEWQSILKPEVFTEVKSEVLSKTPPYTTEELEIEASEQDYDDIIRGNSISDIVHQHQIACKHQPELKAQLKDVPAPTETTE